MVRTQFNQFGCDNWFGFQEFGLKKSSKSPFDCDLSLNLRLGQLDCLSLQSCN